jgi:hypothetical protein
MCLAVSGINLSNYAPGPKWGGGHYGLGGFFTPRLLQKHVHDNSKNMRPGMFQIWYMSYPRGVVLRL